MTKTRLTIDHYLFKIYPCIEVNFTSGIHNHAYEEMNSMLSVELYIHFIDSTADSISTQHLTSQHLYHVHSMSLQSIPSLNCKYSVNSHFILILLICTLIVQRIQVEVFIASTLC